MSAGGKSHPRVQRRAPQHPTQSGFSLLELLVAVAIMAMSLGLIYRAAGGSVRSVGDVEQRVYALALAESVLASYDGIPEGGLVSQGESAGLRWQMRTELYPTPDTDPTAPRLHQINVLVTWGEADKRRQVELVSLLPERQPVQRAATR